MIIVESLMISILGFISLMASVSDFRKGTIPNILLIIGLCIGMTLNLIYYWLFGQSIIKSFIVNLIVGILISLLFYGFHVWSAGDSKLSILLMFLIPGRVYADAGGSIAPCILIFIFIFSIGFIYAIGESIVVGIGRRDLFSFKGIHLNFRDFIIRFFSISAILFLLAQAVSFAFPVFFLRNHLLILFINLFIILLIQDQKWLNQPIFALPLVLVCVAIALLMKIRYVINWQMYIIVALIILLRSFAEKYNYEEIETSKIKAGMILSFGTIMRFHQSRVKDLPQYTTEDLRTKLTEEDINAIHRWEKSKDGGNTIVIVRKLPFAIIVSVSTILFILVEVFLI